MLMLCFRIACIHVLPVKAIPEPSLEVVCLHASFFWTASDPDLKQNLYVKNPSSNGNDIRRFPAGTWWCADAMGNEPQKRVCSLAGTTAMPGFYLTPFWICSARKTAKTLLLPIWQKFMMQNPLNFCPGTLPLQPCGRIHCLSVSLFHRKGEFRTGYSSFSAMAVA